MAYVYHDTRKKPHVYRFQFTDHLGRRRTGTGTTSKADTESMASIVQAKANAIRRKWADAPKASDTPRDIAKVIEEYLAWGKAQGGHGGRAWAEEHLQHKRARLEFWRERLGLQTPQDISLPKVEVALRELQEKGRTFNHPWGERKLGPFCGKSLQNYSEALRSFCLWAKGRGYLDADPLEGLAGFDTTPKTTRRALTVQEIQKVLDAADTPDDRLLFEVALLTGYRRKELRALVVKDFNAASNTLSLPAASTKGRKDARQPLPAVLALKLAEVCKGKAPDAPLLAVPKRPHEHLYRAMKRADVQRMGPGGKVDFHALRHAYATLVFECGANDKEAQTLMRHKSLSLTMHYAKARNTRLTEVAENIGEKVMESTPLAYSLATGTDGAMVKAIEGTACAVSGGNSKGGSNPRRDAILKARARGLTLASRGRGGRI